MANSTVQATRVEPVAIALDTEFHRGLGLYDSTMVVVGSGGCWVPGSSPASSP